jgi:hypothetical protein
VPPAPPAAPPAAPRVYGPSAGLVGPCYGGEVLCFNGATAAQVMAARDSLSSLPQESSSTGSARARGFSSGGVLGGSNVNLNWLSRAPSQGSLGSPRVGPGRHPSFGGTAPLDLSVRDRLAANRIARQVGETAPLDGPGTVVGLSVRDRLARSNRAIRIGRQRSSSRSESSASGLAETMPSDSRLLADVQARVPMPTRHTDFGLVEPFDAVLRRTAFMHSDPNDDTTN